MDKDVLYRYFAGEVSPEELHEIKLWSEQSEANRDTLRRERKLFNAMLLAGSSQLAADANDGGLQSQAEDAEMHPHKLKGILLRVAACVALVAGLGAAYLWFSGVATPNQLAYQTVRVPSGQRVDLILPDSTHVWVNANTTVRYPLEFAEESRDVELDGEAYFEVKHNNKCPFVVHTSKMDIEDLGTKFNVDAYSGNNYQEASLIEGKVSVKMAGSKGHTYVLEPGRMFTVAGGKERIEDISDTDKYRWTEGLYCFSAKTIAQIMKDFEKFYGVRIVIDNRQISKVALSGKFRIAEGLDYALSVLQAEASFKYHRSADGSTIFIK